MIISKRFGEVTTVKGPIDMFYLDALKGIWKEDKGYGLGSPTLIFLEIGSFPITCALGFI